MRERYQNELAKRADSSLPFEEKGVAREVIRTINDGMHKIKRGSGSIVYPFPLTKNESLQVRGMLVRQNSGLARRVEGFYPIRLEEGIGTEIVIRGRKQGI